MQRKNSNALRRVLAGLLVVGTPLVGACSHRPSDAKTTDVTPQDVVAALEDTHGVHPGERRNHTKGPCAGGEFVGRPEAAVFSRSALFAGPPVPVVARFSLAGGDPDAADAEKSPRGMALEFRLPDGTRQHMTMLNTPTFFAAVPRTFLDEIGTMKPGPATGNPSPPKLAALASSDPDSRRQTEFLAEHNPPPSYANSAYYGIHTFKFVDRDDQTTLVRWRFLPEDGERALSDAELASRPANFLESALIERTKQGPVRWSMRLTIGEPDDPEDDPTVEWPSDRIEVTAGILTVTSATPQTGGECEKINYDPLVMADGIVPSGDRILLFRSPSYALSFTRRLQGQ